MSKLTLSRRRSLQWLTSLAGMAAAGVPPALLLSGCVTPPPTAPMDAAQRQRAADRIGWGATQAQLSVIERVGWPRYVEHQLKADPALPLPAPYQAAITALQISRTDPITRVREAEALRRNADKDPSEANRVALRQSYQAARQSAVREAGERQLIRQWYSDQQLLEQMAWFWFNHFNVHQAKRDVALLLPDYEDRALRPQTLGSFRLMLGAVARHPAMLRYLDNDQNAARAINENYARELLELHTMGVDGGYTQRDVQELARVLTGFGVRLEEDAPRVNPKQAALYQRDGFFEFHPARHDFGDKQVLGRTIRGRGAEELDEVLDLLVAQPATARHISRKLAIFFLSDQPPPALVDEMARTFERSRGDVKATLRPLLLSPAFIAPGTPPKFKDPQHYLLSGLRAGFEGRPMVNSQPLQNWLKRLGQGLYDKQTPDGYPLTAEAWNSPGQMTTRFELARQMGGGAAALFRPEGSNAPVPLPDLQPLKTRTETMLAPATRDALAQAGSAQQWLSLFLSSPDFMYR
ncbi:DUF1800 domain-containing protein [Roseateles sp. SL47]|uniref:DUF1800 domain-containing protein n=1 Tax=Roseateles sp. SL47 TaxID=2995138 RepID=UPI00226E93A9|nr:DUF1800 domain-containing protein [Roseateles sp. SL47]WAC73330.1 DUF1800 domain-containing protein [Roseateles sp. SL47]